MTTHLAKNDNEHVKMVRKIDVSRARVPVGAGAFGLRQFGRIESDGRRRRVNPPDVGNLDRAELWALFEDQREPLYRFLFRLTRNAADAEDLTQEAFLTVWRKRDRFEARGSAAGYLRRTAYRLFLNARQRRDRRQGLAPTIQVGGEEELLSARRESESERREAIGFLVERVRDALDGLPDAARDTFVLFRFEGLSCAEIAELDDTPVKTVETRLRRATRLLGQRLRPYRHHMASLTES